MSVNNFNKLVNCYQANVELLEDKERANVEAGCSVSKSARGEDKSLDRKIIDSKK